MSVSMEQLQAVNTKINQQPYVYPSSTEQEDLWKDKPDGGSWVCRDYVLSKADELILLGVSKLNMNIILCWTEPCVPPTDKNNGGREYHAVLLVYGSYILDSRFDPIYTMTSNPHGYIWDKKQIPGTLNFVPA